MSRVRRRTVPLVIALAIVGPLAACEVVPASTGGQGPSASPARLSVALSVPKAVRDRPVDGRMLLLISTDSTKEPRFQITDDDESQQLFGVDVDGLAPDAAATIDGSTLGYPRQSLGDVPAGDYWVQGLLHVYDTFQRGDGHTVKLPPDRGEGQQWNLAPGNYYSTPRRVRVDPSSSETIRIALDKVIPPLDSVPDTKYVKHIRIQSERLTKFWGRPTYLGAIVVLPEGYDTHPSAWYPLAIYHGHFQTDPSGWRETPPDPKLPAYDLKNIEEFCPNGHEGDFCSEYGYDRLVQEKGYEFFKTWTGPGFPRVLMLTIQHANPYYDDSYAVNSENLGPYGDAITYELIPYVEKTFRGLGPWARATYGGSTGGWEALAAQVFYPDQYNGAYANCPDPIDFRMFTVVNIYEDKNAYQHEGRWRTTPRPGTRDYRGRVRATLEELNRKELVLGTKTRSGQQWDIWEAVYSPVGSDGYPKRIWDKRTGVIDTAVAAYWRDHYDLGHILERDWASLGAKVRGKITINVGLSDNFFLNNAVYYVEDVLKSRTNPPADAVVDYGLKDEHCWSGDHANSNAVSRLTYHERFIPQMAERWVRTAPPGSDVRSWRY
jgi:hypothetical protein